MRACLLLLAACAARPVDEFAPQPLGTCGVVTHYPIVDSPHMPIGSVIEWESNPPTSGPHYPIWAAWDRAYAEIERAYWLHNAEHGGVVLAYSCDGCSPPLEAIVRGLPADPHCEAPLWTRSIVVADPLLPDDTTIAAVAWGVAYTATSIDPDALGEFIADNYGRATENTCADGLPRDGNPIE